MLAGSVMLGDLDDFIAPGQSCVNPIFNKTPSAAAAPDARSSARDGALDPRGTAKLSLVSDFDDVFSSVVTYAARTRALPPFVAQLWPTLRAPP